jgi:hypothetical protein
VLSHFLFLTRRQLGPLALPDAEARYPAGGVPVTRPVRAGPVDRARDAAEHAYGAVDVVVTDSRLADKFSGPRLGRVRDEHRRLFSAPVVRGTDRVPVGHRTPGIMVAGDAIDGRAFQEGGALMIEPRKSGLRMLGSLMPAPIEGGRFHAS